MSYYAMPTNPTLELTKQLIQRASITPSDAGCQELLAQHLRSAGFHCQSLPFGNVSNLWATHGSGHPTLVFAGHTDVVPPGPLNQWTTPPFEPSEREGLLFGRGAADMKSSIAAMVIAAQQFVEQHPNHPGTIALLITSDEEGIAQEGTLKVVETLQAQNYPLDYCVVGEPSSTQQLGDTIKVGRRGSLHGILTIHGKQGHIAYPHLAENPIHNAANAIYRLSQESWDNGNAHFPATSFQVSSIHSDADADNIIPGTARIAFNFRFSPESTVSQLQQRAHQLLDSLNIRHTIDWRVSGEPFATASQEFMTLTAAAIQKITGISPEFSTSGGTSDGRFIAPTGCQVIEFGPINRTIHQIDECINVADLEPLTAIYREIMRRVLGGI